MIKILRIPISDEIFKLNENFKADKRKYKINGGIGIYLDDSGLPFVIPAVKKAISLLDYSNFNYLPISGDPSFLVESSKLILGHNLYENYKEHLVKQGVMGGTNGLFIWANLIKLTDKKITIILSNPTWENHKKIFAYFNFNIIEYNHIDINGLFNINSLKETILQYPKAFILFQGGPTHNPTGVNPSQEQWQELADLIYRNGNQICFDFAYMGLGDNIESDCYPIRYFLDKQVKFTVIVSYSKNMTLYQHRTGMLLMLAKTKKDKLIFESQLEYIFRVVNSNPAAFGESIVKTILESNSLRKEWINTVSKMAFSLKRRRQMFNQYTHERFPNIIKQKGLFSLLNLNQKQIRILKKQYGIYLLSNSRINFGGISLTNISKVAKAVMTIS